MQFVEFLQCMLCCQKENLEIILFCGKFIKIKAPFTIIQTIKYHIFYTLKESSTLCEMLHLCKSVSLFLFHNIMRNPLSEHIFGGAFLTKNYHNKIHFCV